MSHLLHDEHFWVGLALLTLFWFAWKPVKAALFGALDARAARIAKDLDDAAKLRAEAEKLLAEYQAKHRDAMAQADAIVTHAREEAARMAAKAEADLGASLRRREEMAMERIAQAEAQATAEVRSAAVDLAMAATAKLLEGRLDAGRQDALAAGAIKALPTRLN
ncbi:MAG: F0F1 ATP synthase subunit B [Alphaproteobacteria bacterium]|nr:F0F1 ATP synthase subunit B [Alphaproteobacteria bacterium]